MDEGMSKPHTEASERVVQGSLGCLRVTCREVTKGRAPVLPKYLSFHTSLAPVPPGNHRAQTQVNEVSVCRACGCVRSLRVLQARLGSENLSACACCAQPAHVSQAFCLLWSVISSETVLCSESVLSLQSFVWAAEPVFVLGLPSESFLRTRVCLDSLPLFPCQ